MSHDFRSKDHILDDLYDAEHEQRESEDDPEVFAGLSRSHPAEQRHRNQSDGLQIRDEVKNADEKSEEYGEREADDLESDGEQDAHAECDERLSAEVAVHAMFHVACEISNEGAVFLRDQMDPSVGDLLIVEEDEEEIEEDDEDDGDADDDGDGAREQRPGFGQHLFGDVDNVIDAEIRHDLVHVEMRLYEVDPFLRNEGNAAALERVGLQDLVEPCRLFRYRRNDERADAGDDQNHGDEGGEHGEYAHAEMEFILEKLHQRLHHIGQQPGDEKREQRITQDQYKVNDAACDEQSNDQTDCSVKCIGLIK